MELKQISIMQNHPFMDLSQFVKMSRKNWKPIFSKENIDFVYLGGSYVTGAQLNWSDIDVFVSWPIIHKKSGKEIKTFLLELQDQLIESSSQPQIELHILESLPMTVQFQVIHSGIVIYERKHSHRTNFIEELLPKYYDFMIWFKQYLKESVYNDN